MHPEIDTAPIPRDNHQQTRMKVIGLSLTMGILLMAAKFYAYAITQSSAVLSDALESIINVVASAFAMGSVWFAAKPPDADHPYGHGKIEYFSAGFEGALIIIAAIGIFKTGLTNLIHPSVLPHLEAGLLVLAVASGLNLMLAVILIRTGRRTGSLILVADGQHILTDVYTSAGVIIGLALVYATGWLWLDGAIACVVGLHILVTGSRLVRQSFSALMDSSNPDLLDEISNLLDRHRKDYWIDIHQLRAWRSGNHIHMDFHLVLPRNFSLVKTHAEIKELEALMADHFNGNASILVHTDPCGDPHCPVCQRYECELRKTRQEEKPQWTRKNLTKPSPSNGK
jgi:cation diffusion facilitator family transporter